MHAFILVGASVCSLLSPMMDGIVYMRDSGMSKEETVSVIRRTKQSDELKMRAEGAVNVFYTSAPSVDDNTRRELVLLGCDNKEIIRAYQYPSEGTRGRARNLSHDEFGARRRP